MLGISELRTYQPIRTLPARDAIGIPLKPQYFIPRVCALHEQSAPAAKQQKKIRKYNYFWLKQSFEQVFFFPEGASPLYALKEMGSISTTQGGLP